MAPELGYCQMGCTTPALDFYSAGTPERTGVATDDHGWAKGGFNASNTGSAAVKLEAFTSTDFYWGLCYFFIRDVLADGEYINVLIATTTLTGPVVTHFSARLYNVSGTYKWRLWNITDDVQIGTDSAAQTVGAAMLVNFRAEHDADQLDLFVDGSSVISASQELGPAGTVVNGLRGDSAGAATDLAYWSAACQFYSASDDLNEADYPEMRLLHPNGEGTYGDYTSPGPIPAAYDKWDDLKAEGNPDGDTTLNDGLDGSNQRETSTLTTHEMANTIMGMAELFDLKATSATKTVVHGGLIRVGGTDKVVSFGSEDIGETYVVREAVFHTEPSTGTWTQALVDGMEAGHRRDAGSSSLAIRVTAMGLVVVALGATDLGPPDPPVRTWPQRRPAGVGYTPVRQASL